MNSFSVPETIREKLHSVIREMSASPHLFVRKPEKHFYPAEETASGAATFPFASLRQRESIPGTAGFLPGCSGYRFRTGPCTAA